MSVTKIDRGWNRITKELKLMDNSYVNVGVLSDAGSYEGGTTLAEVATANEFGVPSKNIPARPFMAQAFDKAKEKLGQHINGLVSDIYRGIKSTKGALAELGEDHKGNVQGTFVTGDFAPNSPVTKAIKGSGQPLIDTGRLRQSINYEVKLK
jgi:phage gpG-like protein